MLRWERIAWKSTEGCSIYSWFKVCLSKDKHGGGFYRRRWQCGDVLHLLFFTVCMNGTFSVLIKVSKHRIDTMLVWKFTAAWKPRWLYSSLSPLLCSFLQLQISNFEIDVQVILCTENMWYKFKGVDSSMGYIFGYKILVKRSLHLLIWSSEVWIF